ncbi:ribosomal protein S16 [Hamiltosporidium tvaerminnensis]|uniref:Ribosomal protein S16 n=2 Tax=Hamiltosporidium TaxID=1176354 RepID=A0A4Q9LNF2_9MICR|nr:40S ribosomal protein S16 [Hamiltosporidium tvaerminnensis]TBU03612.1 ribosomal protein S16 [Hamiltosporidium tvaerminnensis]TBU07974.1 ribosomal protein S16 [Hamiltosporidium magnivora]TBU09963.1 ribosomal protein S16 [Hamiltosporidium magnivora]TBU20923.1 ribosomal protein S16 [Hamiltosporidium tvaerminnensis]
MSNIKEAIALGSKKTAKATSICTEVSEPFIRINKVPLNIFQDKLMLYKMKEVINVVGTDVLSNLGFDISVRGGGNTSSIYAVRQAFAKSIIAYYGKYFDEYIKQEIKNKLLAFDRYSLITDPRRAEAKKFGGPGARARYQKSYR